MIDSAAAKLLLLTCIPSPLLLSHTLCFLDPQSWKTRVNRPEYWRAQLLSEFGLDVREIRPTQGRPSAPSPATSASAVQPPHPKDLYRRLREARKEAIREAGVESAYREMKGTKLAPAAFRAILMGGNARYFMPRTH
jgi:hypothetical protein